jgi:hypothetical protein
MTEEAAGEAGKSLMLNKDIVESESEEFLSEHIYNTILKTKPEDLKSEVVFREHRSKSGALLGKGLRFASLIEKLEKENGKLRREVEHLRKQRKRIDGENEVLVERLNESLTKE